MTPESAGRSKIEIALLVLILLTYSVLAVLYAVKTPAWQVPDEPAHYNYVAQVASGGCCPMIAPQDWDAAYLEELKASGFDPTLLGNLPAVQYEDHQPPLYYLLAAPVYALTNGSLTALRLFSAALGLGVILCVYGAARAASGGNGPIALGAAAFAAFVPQHLAILSGVGNDALAELIVAAGVWLAIEYVNGVGAHHAAPLRRFVHPSMLGILMGLGFLTKASTWMLALVILLAIWLRWRRTSPFPVPSPTRGEGSLSNSPPSSVGEGPGVGGLGLLFRAGALFLIPALILGSLWWLRNLGVYGWPDFMGLAAHDRVVVGQLRTAEMIARDGFGAWLGEGARVTFQSFWGQFGWMGVPMPTWVYAVLLAFTGIAYAGLIPLAARARREGISPERRDAAILMAAVFALGIAQFLYYNTAFVQFQGRYLYPAMSAFALAVSAGLYGWTRLIADRWPWLRWLPPLILFGLAGLSAYALWRFVIPNLRAW